MKIPSIIFGLFFLFSNNNSKESISSLDLFQEKTIDTAGDYYFKIPNYEGEMTLILKVFTGDYKSTDCSVLSYSYQWDPSDEEIVNAIDFRYIWPGSTYIGESNGRLEYSLYPEYAYTKNFVIRLILERNVKIKFYIMEKGHVFPIKQAEETRIKESYGTYYFKTPAFGKDKMLFKLKVYDLDFTPEVQVYFKGFKEIPNDYDIRNDYKGWLILLRENIEYEPDYDVYTFPFEASDEYKYYTFTLSINFYGKTGAYISESSFTFIKIKTIFIYFFISLLLI